MATTRLTTTVLPHSVNPAGDFHVSLFFSHRLEGSGQLSDYPAMGNWVAALKNAIFELHTDNSGGPIACTPLLQSASESAWQTAFPPGTTVRDFAAPTVTGPEWKTFPANRMPGHALDAHQASLCSSPVNRPTVSGSPLAGEVLRVFAGVDGLADLIGSLRGYDAYRARYRDGLAHAGVQAAQAAVTPVKPAPGQGGGHGPAGPILRIAAAERPHQSAIEILQQQDDVDSRVSAHLDGYADGTRPVTGPTEQMLRDTHVTHRYYYRPEEQNPPALSALSALPAPADQDQQPPDFHERASGAGNVPALLRALGLVVDVKVDAAGLDTLAHATQVWCRVTVAGTEEYATPKTLCAAAGNHFYAVPSDPDRWSGGLLKVGDDSRYTVVDLDPDAAGLALEQLLRSAIRAQAIESNGDRGSFSPAALRSTGFAIAEIDRPDRLKTQVTQSEQVQQQATQQTGSTPAFNYEGLLRGLRVEVWDDVTDTWHSLHERTVTASFGDQSILPGVPDTGLLQNPPMNRVPGSDQNPYYVHEVVAGWDGWSLSAPRPWKEISEQSGGPQPPLPPALQVQSVAAPGSLPALRYGRTYSFRIAGVDLAGNSVRVDPSDAAPQASQIDSAGAHLDTLRTRATEQDAATLTAALKLSGKLQPPPSVGGDDRRVQIERAMTSVVEHADLTRIRPELAVSPEHLAALSGPTGDPATVSAPRAFLRWDPVTAPTLAPRTAYTTGESLQRMVIRTGLTGIPGLCQRHVVPPKGSELEAEQDGRLDALMKAGDTARAYAIALKERGSLFYEQIQDLNNPNGTVTQPGIALLSPPNVGNPKTLAEIQDPNVQPAEGQYIVHDVDDLVLPYLPDPMAAGFSLVFYEAGADHRFDDPRVLQSVTVTYPGAWPELQPLRLVLHDAPRLDARQQGNVIDIGLPQGQQVGMKLSTTIDAEHLGKMGLWVINPVNDANVPAADREVLANAACDGWLWWLTPDEDLRLVHATARPAIPPRISRLIAKPRTPSVATVNLDGVLDVHGVSTDKVQLRARWTDRVDDLTAPAPSTRTNGEVVADYRIGDSERFSLITLDPDAKTVGSRTVDEPIRTAIHNLPDTKARTVIYRLSGTSRYREFFGPHELPPADDPGSMGNEIAVDIPSSAAPAPPVVHAVIPMFQWEQTTEPEHPFAVRRTRRSGVRIWLDRPWYSSGDGEMLAIITTGDPDLIVGSTDNVSLWARDPIVVGPAIADSYEVPVLAAWQQRAVQLRLAPESLAARPSVYVVKAGAPPADRDKVVNAYAYRPEFHPDRKLWFVDAVLETTDVTWPFLRLAVARYQANSLPDLEFSQTVPTDFVQLPPERISTLSRPDVDHVRISVTGVAALTNAPGVGLPAQSPDHDTLANLLPKTHRVVATLQARAAESGSDLDWIDRKVVQCSLAGVDAATFAATWTAELPLEPAGPLVTPGTATALRVQIEEYEVLSADPLTVVAALTPSERLVYADHFYL